MVDPGEGPLASLIIIRPNWGPRGTIKCFFETGAPPLSQCLDDPTPALSEGLDLPPLSGMVFALAQKLFGLVRSWPG